MNDTTKEQNGKNSKTNNAVSIVQTVTDVLQSSAENTKNKPFLTF